ncbi:MAG: RagB/SusD family nutrient uptake outer membrane protein [Flavobacteriaceae bacterium]|jgi:hypothetical protein|nr:RagB/SusD family nutrient uptake outer membrane protein [Flavobacteriaceae bacterium]
MKKIKYIILGLITGAFTLQSCSEDKMDDINKNKNNPEFMESKYIITDVMTSSAFSITGSDLAFYASIYTEQLGGVSAQLRNAQLRGNEPSASTTYNNKWNTLYSNLRSLNIIVKKCSTGGEEAGNYHTLGIAQVLKAYNLGILTDLFGDVPYSEALSPLTNPQAKLDKQEDIYKEIFSLLDSGIENLNKQTTFASLGKQDLIYNSPNNWIKAAYGLKARYLMHLSAVKPNYQEVLNNVNLSFAHANEEMYFQDGKVSYPFFLVNKTRGGLASSKTLWDMMTNIDVKDPRIADYFIAIEGKGVVPVDHNKDVQEAASGVYSPSGLSYSSVKDAKYEANSFNAIYLMSYHELMFIKAEAAARLNLDSEAKGALSQGINAALNKKQRLTYPTYERVVPQDLTGKALLQRIAQEKYISFAEVESIEMYNDIRRWKAMGDDLIQLQHKEPNKFPKRFAYGNSDVSRNPHVKEAYGNGAYVYTDDVWWAHGTR